MDNDALNRSRSQGLFCAPGTDAVGLAGLVVLEARGADAASFLHSQLTNDVEGLSVGQGNLNARVNRTGHLQYVFSLHRVAQDRFFLILERALAEGLRQSLDGFLFVDKVELEFLEGDWVSIQGGSGQALLKDVFDMEAPSVEHSVAELPDAWLIRRSLTGDAGWLLFGQLDLDALGAMAQKQGLFSVDTEQYSELIEVLRMEAGGIRVDVDLAGHKRLLPEVGIEHQTVSYAKGCYLGQEVIARVRTYGSVPRALRGLQLMSTPLKDVPAPGEVIRLSSGDKVGVWSSRCESPEAKSGFVYAFLGRNHRTPGSELALEGKDGAAVNARVVLLPLYRARDTQERIGMLYDRAVRVYAEGHISNALSDLETILKLDPTYADAYELIGVMLGKSGRYHEAIDFFRRLEEVAPDEPMVNTNLSVFYMKIGDRTTAEDQSGIATQKKFRQTKWKDKTSAEIAEEQQTQARKAAERKLVMFGRVLAIDEEDGVALFGSGTSHSTLGNWEEAVVFFEKAVLVDGQNSAAHLGYGKALEALGRNEDAIRAYQAGMEVASRRGDLMPLREMEHRVLVLSA